MTLVQNYRQLLDEYISFRSISTDKKYLTEIQKTVTWLKKLFQSHKFNTQVITGYGNPVLLAESPIQPDLPTVLVYGHYDVQPAAIDEGWSDDPFTVTETPTHLIARGIADNKGQTLIHLVTAFELLKANQLGWNVKFLLEGDEETGSGNMSQLITDYQDEIQSDVVLISDGKLFHNQPTLEASFRGSLNFTLKVLTSTKELHSGSFGGAVPSASQELAKIIATFTDANNNTLIPGFSEGITYNPQVKDTFVTQTCFQPALIVTGLKAGYIEAGYRNSIPATAEAKVNLRSTPEQDPLHLLKLLKKHLVTHFPSYVTWSLEHSSASKGAIVDTHHKYAQYSSKILKKVYGKEVVTAHAGGTLPIINDIQALKIPLLLLPLANEDCGMHEVNENFELEYIRKGLAFSHGFLKKSQL